jgi:hypothetical protein
MKYNAFYKGRTYSFNYDPKYEPMDFIRNNDDIDFFKVEDWKPVINMEAVVEIMIECYKDMLEKNYL